MMPALHGGTDGSNLTRVRLGFRGRGFLWNSNAMYGAKPRSVCSLIFGSERAHIQGRQEMLQAQKLGTLCPSDIRV